MLRASLPCRLALALLAAGCARSGVVRVMDGRAVEGRFISERAYAYYAEGADAEAHGELVAALQRYELAAREDGASPEIWTRLGAVRCRVAGAFPAAGEAFARAEGLDAGYEPLWRERARCLLAQGSPGEAFAQASRALALDPDQDDDALLRGLALEKLGRGDDARRALTERTVRRPGSLEAWRALAELAQRQGDDAGAERARRQAEAVAGARGGAAGAPDGRTLAAIDRALLDGDLRGARRDALHARLPAAELAVRAAALGKMGAAREEAELVLGADPADASARLVLAVAATAAGDAATASAALRALPAASVTPPSPLARLLFAELLGRMVGREEAVAWLGPVPAADALAPDALLESTRTRVRAELGI